MLNVLVVSQYIEPHIGGAERYIHEVCSRLQGRGIKIRHLSAVGGSERMISPPFRFLSAGFNPLWPGQVANILRKLKPGVIFAHFTVPGITDVVARQAKRLDIPVCLVYHSDITGPDFFRRSAGYLYYRTAGLRTLECSDRIIVCSQEYKKASLWLSCLEKPLDFIPCGVDPVMAEARREPSFPYLFFAGKAGAAGKGFDVLYKAWLNIICDFPELELLAAGKAIRAHKYPGVRFLGQVNSRRELGHLYASASATILPSTSTSESFGMVLAESLAAGTPVVGSDIGGIRAVVQEGVNGYLASPGDAHSLAEAIQKVLGSEEKLRQNVRKYRGKYLEIYNWDRITDRVEEVLYILKRDASCACKKSEHE